MYLAVPYMGTKRDLAPVVANVICNAKQGVVLDVFSGMCAIGQAIGTRRNIWNNDIQCFASKVASALFTSKRPFRLRRKVRAFLRTAFEHNLNELASRFRRRLSAERTALAWGTVTSISEYLESARHVGSSKALDRERRELETVPTAFPYRLCAITFSDGYFGLQQSIEIDSARYALDMALAQSIIDEEEFRWFLIAICHAAVRIATTTGHFAQFLKIKANNSIAYVGQRRRSFWDTWLDAAAAGLCPVGSAPWRKRNKAFNRESLTLLGLLSVNAVRPSVVYADPPYTDDQYSRYYHVWETLIKYDYPSSEGVGRYRPDRFQTPFSRTADVRWAFEELIRRSAELDADLVISYPDHGLLQHAGHDVATLLKRFYSKVSVAVEVPHRHSTMGASKGTAKNPVIERVYLARNI